MNGSRILFQWYKQWERTVPAPPVPPLVPHRMAWDWTQASGFIVRHLVPEPRWSGSWFCLPSFSRELCLILHINEIRSLCLGESNHYIQHDPHYHYQMTNTVLACIQKSHKIQRQFKRHTALYWNVLKYDNINFYGCHLNALSDPLFTDVKVKVTGKLNEIKWSANLM